MIKNYFKIAWRSIWKHKAYSIINIAGLSIGLTACLIVATVVFDELSYDRQWSKGDNIYRILTTRKQLKGSQPEERTISAFAPAIKKDFPQVDDYCRLSFDQTRFKIGKDKQGTSLTILDTEASIWNLFDFEAIKGDPKTHVKGYKNLVITQKIADQYFENVDPVGKIIKNIPQFGGPEEYLITGVIKNIPTNTHLRADVMIVREYPAKYNQIPGFNDGQWYLSQYILLKPSTSINELSNKVNATYGSKKGSVMADFNYQFQPVKDIYLKSDFEKGGVNSSIRTVYIFGAVAALLLIIACVNFVNLSISRVFNRAKETGIRKVLGAEKLQLIGRYLAESLLFFIIAFVVAIILYPFFIKPVQTYMGHHLVLNLYNSTFLILTVCGVFIVSLLTGLYPAWYLSRPKPVVILRNNLSGGVQLNLLKKVLVVGQFVISAAIILVTLVVNSQLNYISKKDLGYDKNNLLGIDFSNWGTQGETFKQAVKRIPGVENASISGWSPTQVTASMSMDIDVPGQKEKITANYIWGDIDLIPTLKFKLKNGRTLDPNLATDAMPTDSVFSGNPKTREVVNTLPTLATNYTASLLTLKLNKPFKGEGMPVGIIEDFNNESLRAKLQPTFIQAHTNITAGYMLIRIKPGTQKAVLTSLNNLYKDFYPEHVLKYSWVDEMVDKQYKAEHKLQQLFTCFSFLIIFLACLGLFGLVSFTASQRLKEISIRKVLGAGINHIVVLISKDYLLLVIIAIIIASPIAWYFMQQWLQDFAYRMEIEWWMFALTGFITLAIALITISFQSLKAALSNPVKNLKND